MSWLKLTLRAPEPSRSLTRLADRARSGSYARSICLQSPVPLCMCIRPGGGGDLAPSLPGCVVTKWRDMGSFRASREWEGVHGVYGYVFTGISTGMGRMFGFVTLSCDSHYLKTN